jgi:hypothetical protein
VRFAHGRSVVLLQPVRAASGDVVEPAGTRGVVQRETGAVVIVRFEDGRTISIATEKLGKFVVEHQACIDALGAGGLIVAEGGTT